MLTAIVQQLPQPQEQQPPVLGQQLQQLPLPLLLLLLQVAAMNALTMVKQIINAVETFYRKEPAEITMQIIENCNYRICLNYSSQF